MPGSLTVLGDAFYRLAVHNAERGVVIEEFESLDTALAAVDSTLGDRPRTVTVEDEKARFEGTSAMGANLLVVLSYYHRTSPPDPRWRERAQRFQP